MIITPIPLGFELCPSTAGRSTGLHASDIYGDLYQDLEPKRYKRDSKPDPVRMELGLALEHALEGGLAGHLWQRPGEFTTKEGIVFSPDGLIFHDDGRLIVIETKLTWQGSREAPREPGNSFPQRWDKWLVQLMFYCEALGTEWGRLYVYFVNGTGAGPEFLSWECEFTGRELQENYLMMRNHAKAKGML